MDNFSKPFHKKAAAMYSQNAAAAKQTSPLRM
jgi:hypothetical protein